MNDNREASADSCSAESPQPRGGKESRRLRFHGTEFTAIHFLSADAELEADIRRRYGDLVADLMRRDRRDNVRRVFRTYPFHHWPRGRRRFNPLALYDAYLEGGRVLWLPPRVAWWSVRLLAGALRMLWRFVGEVLNPSVGDLDSIERPDPFAVAVRKIHRMRKPVFMRCLRMRAEFDPEYLGVALPGVGVESRQATFAPIEEDLALIGTDARVVGTFRDQAAECRRRMLDFRRLLPEIDADRLSPESLRAAAVAYAIDYRRVRRRLEAIGRLETCLEQTVDQPASGRGSPRQWWRRWRMAGRVDRLLAQPVFRAHATRRAVFLRAICRPEGASLRRDLRVLTRRRGGADPRAEALEVLRQVARDPATWSRQLVILRAVQTLSVLDLRTYCDLVAELGEYGPCQSGEKEGG